MKKRERRKNPPPFPWLSNFNKSKFNPFIRAIGQAALLWNDLHEWMGLLYGSTMCAGTHSGIMNPHHSTWAALTNDRAKRDVLLATAKTSFVDLPVHQTELQKRSYESIKWLCDKTTNLENDRNNIIHAPLWRSQAGDEIYPASAYGNQRASQLDNKYLLKEYERIRDAARLLRNYAVEIYDPMSNARLPWPDTPDLPDRGATKRPPPFRPKLYTKPSPQPQS